MKNVVIFGASGQLGHCFKQVAENEGITSIYFPPESEADILNPEALARVFNQYQPFYVVNCAAYTAVDKAEDDIELAEKINRTGAANLAKVCAEYGSVLIHVSTDFVFEGNNPIPRKEDDVAQPINVYGQTKLDGEKDIAALLEKYFILRTSWLYSEYGNNFVKTMLKLGSEREELKIIADQIGTPTYGIDLAYAIMQIVNTENTCYGIYHYSNEGVASWYDFAHAIFELSDTHVKVLPIPTSDYKTRAIRPAYSVMDKGKIKSTLGIEIPHWRDSLHICINRLING
ncbi:dTDP-4-dehydrorhamnose reductase [Mucilaginibacter hurinus]|uniref:dTDP-4-dehydrorhamnose reductase n=1 Tax=Mucilaginibacter hurinus TaxID=2201324 RepID=A0A367GTS6_9SPHI|nr:dTDP-4-dehydrorhamnose reductase [Mucilaginibacter hurinus]RCH56578.1 dTDP-4-dehydrorhamnose reductase [Mucilaginibacter hurinus]